MDGQTQETQQETQIRYTSINQVTSLEGKLGEGDDALTVAETVEDMFEYHKWTPEQLADGALVRRALADAVRVIIVHVPPGPDRTVAIRKIREARMDANSAITHGGKY